MKKSAYGKPILISADNKFREINKINSFDEEYIQNIVFEFPSCLPISDIDEAFNPLIPVCTELNTPVGPLDILMITPYGDIAIIETKLWRNPEARRKVIAQILDYAKELSRWSYEDLTREVNRKLGTKGNILYTLAHEKDEFQLTEEKDFVDSVSRNLARGKFLLLIVGDGIKEGAQGISEFLSNSAHLNFTIAMVELSIYESPELGKLIIPQTIVKTKEISKLTIEIPFGHTLTINDERDTESQSTPNVLSTEREAERQFYIRFWSEFIKQLNLDDPGQALPSQAKGTNLYLYPGNNKKSWISAYFSKSKKLVGVYFRVGNDQEGRDIFKMLDYQKEEIRRELGDDILWTWEESNDVGVRFYCNDVFANENRIVIIEFFNYWLNIFVNVFRPRIKSISQEME